MRQTFVLGSAALFLVAAACGSGRTATFAYVGNNDLSSVSVFRVDAKTGMLTLARTVDTAPTSADSVSAFAVASGGALTPIAGSPFAAGHTPYDVKLAASGKFAYAVNRDTDDVSAWAVNAATGALAPIANQPFAVACRAPPCGPRADPATGRLSPMATVPTAGSAFSIALR